MTSFLQGKGVSDEAIIAEENQKRCVSPMTDKELQRASIRASFQIQNEVGRSSRKWGAEVESKAEKFAGRSKVSKIS